jgi:DNA-directed RNA polymerase subunit RPC12/RpoP
METLSRWRFERRIRQLENDYVRCSHCDGDGHNTRLGTDCVYCTNGWLVKRRIRNWPRIVALAVGLTVYLWPLSAY